MNWRDNSERRYRRAGQGLTFVAISLTINWLVAIGTVELVRYQKDTSELSEDLFVIDLEKDDFAKQLPLDDIDPKVDQIVSNEDKEPKEEPKPEPESDVERLPEPKVEEEPEPVPDPVPEDPVEPLPPLPPVPPQMKIVEQLDKFDEEFEPTDPNYLSNVNRDVREETRAEITNLTKDADRPESEANESEEDLERGHATENKIAEQDSTPRQEQQRAKARSELSRPSQVRQTGQTSQSLLSMRSPNLDPQIMPSKSPELELNQAPDGMLAPIPKSADIEHLSKMSGDSGARHDKLNPLRMSRQQVIAQVGQDWKYHPHEGSTSESKKKGVWDDVRRHYQSPLENMVPEVKVGNQTALRSRKVPFARFIATMHRGIHEIWAYGYLEQWDTRGRNDLFADQSLWTRVEIVLSSTGQIDNVKTVHFSGNSAFDGVAREVVWSAGPYPEPPAEIRSGNGKVYMHWTFHRNERACGTFGATPYILDNAGNGDRPDPHGEIVMAPSSAASSSTEKIRRLAQRQVSNTGSSSASIPLKPPHSTANNPGRSLGKFGAPRPKSPSKERLPVGVQNRSKSEAIEQSRGALNNSLNVPNRESVPRTSDPLAASVAHGWIGGLMKGAVQAMALRSSTPFYVGSSIAARNRKELRALFAGFVEENQGGRKRHIVLFSASDLLRELGSLPSGVRAGENRLYAMVELGEDSVVLVLAKKNGSWRVVGISR